ncbi:MAG: hypothetical protein N3G78_11535 [Desulfobacterota bacterium]|nr:hypothetical protein [Thermodesulfobacteriota bacterium]
MISIQRPAQAALEIDTLLIDLEGTLAADGRIHPKAKDKINLLSKRVKIYIFLKDRREKIEERLRTVKAERIYLETGGSTQGKLDLLRKLDPQRTVVIGNGVDDGPLFEEAGFSICVIGREGASGEALRKADLVVTDILHGLDFLLKPLRQQATLGQ